MDEQNERPAVKQKNVGLQKKMYIRTGIRTNRPKTRQKDGEGEDLTYTF